jgi:flagellar biosynthetic protein FlhB
MAEEEKEEAPTARKRSKAAEDGQIPQSKDFASLGVMGAGVAGMVMSYSAASQQMIRFTMGTLGDLGQPIGSRVGMGFLNTAAALLLPMMGCVVLASIAVGLMQVGVRFQMRPPRWDFLNPLPGLKRMMGSVESLVKIFFSMVKLVVLGWICVGTLWGWVFGFIQTEPATFAGILGSAGEVVLLLLIRLGIAMTLLGVADYMIEKYRNEKKLKMSKQEIKDEMKQAEGSPEAKGHRKRKQFEMAQQRSIMNVPQADVVVVNPTHYAVALAYETGTMDAPKVVAKGSDGLAERIRGVARRSGVPILARPPLARALYRRVKVGHSVPGDLFNAVAVVFAYVYRIRRNRRAS